MLSESKSWKNKLGSLLLAVSFLLSVLQPMPAIAAPVMYMDGYTYDVISETSEYAIPRGVKILHVILVGGGSGGDGGYDGNPGQSLPAQVDFPTINLSTAGNGAMLYASTTAAGGGRGGQGGDGGNGGKINSIDITVNKAKTMSISIGRGGLGGEPNGGMGTPGEPSTITIGDVTLSSDEGTSLSTGYFYAPGQYNVGSAGDSGYQGQNGGASATFKDGNLLSNGRDGNSFQDYHGGAWADEYVESSGSLAGISYTLVSAGGAGGGGAAYGNDGHDATLRKGGTGADAIAPEPEQIYGKGGAGGNGGGGGGGAGTAYGTIRIEDVGNVPELPIINTECEAGAPGKGSYGGDGASGCVIVYYSTYESNNGRNGSADGVTHELINSVLLNVDGYTLGKNYFLNEQQQLLSYETAEVDGLGNTKVLRLYVEAEPKDSGYLYGYATLNTTGQRFQVYWDEACTITKTPDGGVGYVLIPTEQLSQSVKNGSVSVHLYEYADAELLYKTCTDTITAKCSVDLAPPVISMSLDTMATMVNVNIRDTIAGVSYIEYTIENVDGSTDRSRQPVTSSADLNFSIEVSTNTKAVTIYSEDGIGNGASATIGNIRTQLENASAYDQRFGTTTESKFGASVYYYRTSIFNYWLINSGKTNN